MLAYSGKGRFLVEELDLSDLVREMGRMREVSVSKKADVRYALAAALPALNRRSARRLEPTRNHARRDALETQGGKR
jgi:hypothetical protein